MNVPVLRRVQNMYRDNILETSIQAGSPDGTYKSPTAVLTVEKLFTGVNPEIRQIFNPQPLIPSSGSQPTFNLRPPFPSLQVLYPT